MDDLRKKQALQVCNIVSPVICGIVTAIVSTGIGIDKAFIENSYQKLIDPAPLTFAIWGVVFLFLAMFVLYQARDLVRPLDEKIDMPYVRQVSVFFMLSTIAATIWYLLWLRRLIWPSVAAMAAYLIFVLTTYLRLNINKVERSLREHLFVVVGWSLYAGWITAALIVNASTGFASIGLAGLTGISEATWAIIALLMAVVIYLLVLFRRNDYIFAAVGVWAIFGIILERLDPANAPQPQVALVAAAGAIILAAAIAVRAFFAMRREKPRTPRVKDLGRGRQSHTSGSHDH